MRAQGTHPLPPVGLLLGAVLLLLLGLPLLALLVSSSPSELRQGLASPLFAPALWLSLRTSLLSLVATVLLGTPLAWWLATSRSSTSRLVEVMVDLPVVLPPAVIGVALLQAFGANGLLGPMLSEMGIRLPFTSGAVVLAQVVVSAPFFVQAGAAAFRKVDPDLLVVARTLGASPRSALLRVAVPIALPGLLAGASLAWARSLGEFGATLLFAGSLPGRTQTMPLAIFAAMEADVRAAVAFSLVLAAIASGLLFLTRLLPPARMRGER